LFYQSWFLKINAKLERLKEWEEGVRAQFDGTLKLEKNILADKVQSLSRSFQDRP